MPSLLLLHGALGAASQFDRLKSLLSPKFDVHTFSFEGHGENASDKSFSLDLFAENLHQYLVKNNLSQVHVFGYSMGGYVALKLAQISPAYFNTVITLGTKFNWTPESAASETKLLNPEKIQEKVPAFAKSLSELHVANDWKQVLNKTANMMLQLGNGGASSDSEFKSIQTKCFIGVGDQDAMVTREETQKIASLIPNAEFYLLENTTHPIDKLDFERLAKLIETKINPG